MRIFTEKSKQTIRRLIENEFHETPDTIFGDINRVELIHTARNLRMTELADELIEMNK